MQQKSDHLRHGTVLLPVTEKSFWQSSTSRILQSSWRQPPLTSQSPEEQCTSWRQNSCPSSIGLCSGDSFELDLFDCFLMVLHHPVCGSTGASYSNWKKQKLEATGAYFSLLYCVYLTWSLIDLDTTLKVSTLYFSLVVAPRTILAGLLSIVTALPYAK